MDHPLAAITISDSVVASVLLLLLGQIIAAINSAVRMGNRMTSIEERVAAVEDDLDSGSKRFDELGKQIGQMNTTLAVIADRSDRTESLLTELRTDLKKHMERNK